MTRAEEAINEIKSWDFLEGKEIEAIHTLIPELRESEDERIRKEIIDFIQWAEDRGMTRHDYHQAKRPAVWIAYLEKQKECVVDNNKTSAEEDERIRARLIEYFQGFLEGYEDCYKDGGCVKWEGLDVKSILAWLEKQKETANSFTNDVIEVRSFRRGLEEGRRLEKQKEQKPRWEINNPHTTKWTKEMIDEKFEELVEEYHKQKPVVTHGETYHVDTLGTQQVIAGKMPEKPASTEDMPYITDEHFYEREPVDSFKYKLAEYMTRSCTKKEGPYGYEYGISAETILKMAEEELLKRGVVQKPAQTVDEKEYIRTIKGLITDFIRETEPKDVAFYQRIYDWLDGRHIEQEPVEYLSKDKVYAIMTKLTNLSYSNLIPLNSDEYKKINEITSDVRSLLDYPIEQKPAEWSEEDEEMLNSCICSIEESKENRYAYKETDGDTSYDHEIAWLKSLRPQSHWKPSEEQLRPLEYAIDYFKKKKNDTTYLESLYEELKKL